jgi:UDP-2,4-diacetamido-2,4,6-trideoxy-beta-L-altropyranose hydrolase
MEAEAQAKPHIIIRADGNAAIGFGHLMRALAFAAHAKKLTSVKMLVRNPDSIAQNACEMYSVELADISEISLDKEAEFVGKMAGIGNVVFLDGYNFDEAYQEMVKKQGAFLVCMDDHHDRFFWADSVVNVSEINNPALVRRDVGTRLAFGLRYALLRPEFSAPIAHHKRSDEVFVCFGGGAETIPLVAKTLNALQLATFKPQKIRVVLNTKVIPALTQLVEEEHHNLPIELISNLSAIEMRDLMINSRIGICSSSTVSLECRAVGLPVAAGYFVANQQGIYKSLLQNHEIAELGNLQEISAAQLAEKISQLWVEDTKYQTSILHPAEIERNYKSLIESWFTELDFSIRDAEVHDVEQYLKWANQPDVRQNAIHTEPILPENHYKWFASRLKSDTTHLFVGMWKGRAVGQIRFDLTDQVWEIDYSVDANFRNRGFGELLIRKGMHRLLQLINGDTEVWGLVKFENHSSAAVFKKANFIEHDTLERSGVRLRKFVFRLSAQLLYL